MPCCVSGLVGEMAGAAPSSPGGTERFWGWEIQALVVQEMVKIRIEERGN